MPNKSKSDDVVPLLLFAAIAIAVFVLSCCGWYSCYTSGGMCTEYPTPVPLPML